MSQKIVFDDVLPEKIRLIAGVDTTYTRDQSIGAVAVVHYDTLELAEKQTASCRTLFPYIPTLLSFREIKPTVLCIRKLRCQPDVFFVDGQGLSHPYRCGFASHLGLVLKKPTVGIAKSKLIGETSSRNEKGGVNLVRYKHKVIGATLSSKNNCKPLYISVGNMISLGTAITLVQHCIKSRRIPEPILIAHKIATEERKTGEAKFQQYARTIRS
jgi:deoxyribonuclease V